MPRCFRKLKHLTSLADLCFWMLRTQKQREKGVCVVAHRRVSIIQNICSLNFRLTPYASRTRHFERYTNIFFVFSAFQEADGVGISYSHGRFLSTHSRGSFWDRRLRSRKVSSFYELNLLPFTEVVLSLMNVLSRKKVQNEPHYGFSPCRFGCKP